MTERNNLEHYETRAGAEDYPMRPLGEKARAPAKAQELTIVQHFERAGGDVNFGVLSRLPAATD